MSISFTKLKTQQSLSDVLTFGKYHGKSIKYVCTKDPKYMYWCLSCFNLLFLDSEAVLFLEGIPRPVRKMEPRGVFYDVLVDQEGGLWDDVPF